MADESFSISEIYALGNQWIELGNTVYAARYATSMNMDKYQWTGDGMVAAHDAWNLVGGSVLDPAVTTCWKIGDAINDYGRALERIQLAEQKAADAAGLASIIGTILGLVLPFGLGLLAKLIAPLLEGLITAITNILRTIGESLQTILNIGAFIGGAVAGGLLQLGTDLLSQLIADKIYDVPFEIDWTAEGINMGIGAAFGGLGGLAGLRGPKEGGIVGPKGIGGKGANPPKIDPVSEKPPTTEHVTLPGRTPVPIPDGPGPVGGVNPGGVGKVPPLEFPGTGNPLGAKPGTGGLPPGRSPAPGGAEPPRTVPVHEGPGATTPPGPPRTSTPGRSPEPVAHEPGQVNPPGARQSVPEGQVKPGGVQQPGAGTVGNAAPPKSTGGHLTSQDTPAPLGGRDGSTPDAATSRSVNQTPGNGGSRAPGARIDAPEHNPGQVPSEKPAGNQTTYKSNFDQQPAGTRPGSDLNVTTDRSSVSAKTPSSPEGLPGGNRSEGAKPPLKEGSESLATTQRTTTGGASGPRDTPTPERMSENGKPNDSSASAPRANERTSQTAGQKHTGPDLEPRTQPEKNQQPTASSAREREGTVGGTKQTSSEGAPSGKPDPKTARTAQAEKHAAAADARIAKAKAEAEAVAVVREKGGPDVPVKSPEESGGGLGNPAKPDPKKPSAQPFGAKKTMTIADLPKDGAGPNVGTREPGMRPGGSNVRTVTDLEQGGVGPGGSVNGGSKPPVDRGTGMTLDGRSGGRWVDEGPGAGSGSRPGGSNVRTVTDLEQGGVGPGGSVNGGPVAKKPAATTEPFSGRGERLGGEAQIPENAKPLSRTDSQRGPQPESPNTTGSVKDRGPQSEPAKQQEAAAGAKVKGGSSEELGGGSPDRNTPRTPLAEKQVK
ncbi:hypothetical protein ACH5A1_26975, partial [Kitasatospora sp. NPDC018616]